MLRDKIEEAISGKLYISVKELHKIGVSKSSISRLTDNGSLIRVARGVYSLRDDSKDNKYLIHNKYKIGVFSHNSALYFHNLIDHDPDVKVMTVNWNYKVSTDGKFNVKFKYVDKKILRLGMEMRSTSFGHKVPVYNVERTICDVIKSDTKMDRQIVNNAIRNFVKSGELSIVMDYASKMGIEKKVRKKLEVFL